jgi:hypothetical protein
MVDTQIVGHIAMVFQCLSMIEVLVVNLCFEGATIHQGGIAQCDEGLVLAQLCANQPVVEHVTTPSPSLHQNIASMTRTYCD